MINGINALEQSSRFFKPVSNNVSAIANGNTFESILSNTIDDVKFSKHASKRLDERSLNLTREQCKRLNEGVEKANQKGIQDSLVLMDSMAFIVNVPSHTVVTALDGTESMDKIFTNIDGAVII